MAKKSARRKEELRFQKQQEALEKRKDAYVEIFRRTRSPLTQRKLYSLDQPLHLDTHPLIQITIPGLFQGERAQQGKTVHLSLHIV